MKLFGLPERLETEGRFGDKEETALTTAADEIISETAGPLLRKCREYESRVLGFNQGIRYRACEL